MVQATVLYESSVVFESEFGATRQVAHAVGDGLAEEVRTQVLDVRNLRHLAPGWMPRAGELLVVGAPTHERGLPTPLTRAEALSRTERSGSALRPEPRAVTHGIREWLDGLDLQDVEVAAFATRRNLPRLVTGSAADDIARRVRHRHGTVVTPVVDFLVGLDDQLLPGELARATSWGQALATRVFGP